MSETVASSGNVVLLAIKKRWRAWLRAIHRDIGYLAVGLTVVYALSGLAINHIQDWDPNFKTYEKSYTIEPIDPALEDDAAIALALERLEVKGTPRETYRAGDEVHLTFDSKKFVVIGEQVTEQGRSQRFFFRVANWLHYNRGKKAWTYVADIYAVMLLYLACSGLFMLKGKLGLRWRGALLVGLGAAVPIGYVVWSGGPDAANKKAAAEAAKPAAAPPAPTPDAPDDDEFARPEPRLPSGAQPAPAAGDVVAD
jgi:hypothetical protein